MEYDFSKTQVLAHHVKLLKQLKRHGPQMAGDMDINALFGDELIRPTRRCRDENVKEIEISDKGNLFLQWRREDMFRHRWPVYLSIAAIIISAAAFIQAFFF